MGHDNGFWRSTPLIALGPVLFLELLLFQNIGQQTALINWDQPLVFLWVVIANAIGIAVAMAVFARPRYAAGLSVVTLGGLLALLATGERSGVPAAIVALYGQVALSVAVATVGVSIASGPTSPGIRATATTTGLGMLLFLALTFLYYVNYELDLPGGTGVVPPVAAGIVLLAVASSIRVHPKRVVMAPSWTPVAAATLLLVLPLGYLAAWGEPRPVAGPGFPVRVVSYNLHQGFDVDGYLAISDLAATIQKEEPDIVALQEVSRGWVIDGSFDMLPWLSRRLDMPYAWGPAADSVWGSAILSRYPISSVRTEPMPNNPQLQLKRAFTEARIDIGNGVSLTVIATHLHNVADEGYLREPQVRALLRAWNNQKWTVIMGDLNARPDDPEMLLLEEAGLKDAYIASRQGSLQGSPASPDEHADKAKRGGYTAPSARPTERIDYIWVSPDLKVRDFSLAESLASDHLPLAVTLEK